MANSLTIGIALPVWHPFVYGHLFNKVEAERQLE